MAGNKNLAEDPYERLANAIILQAVTDYRVVLKRGFTTRSPISPFP